MAEENKTGSAGAGSPEAGASPAADPNLGGSKGQSDKQTPQAKDEGTESASGSKKEEVVPKDQYTGLETKLGEQGKELGETRAFIEEITPLLNKLEGREDLVKAIMEDKVNPELLEAALKGEVSTEEAKIATKAQADVKKELGKEYGKTSPEELSKMIADKISEAITQSEKKLNQRMSESEQLRTFEDQIAGFIANTPDFSEYAVAIQEYLDAHSGLDDIQVAYEAVKGRALVAKQKEKDQENAGEAAKEVAANAAGGGVQSTKVVNDPELVDQLIAGRSNPNIF